MQQTILALLSIILSAQCNAQSSNIIVKTAGNLDTIYINIGEKLFFEAEPDANNNLTLKQVNNPADETKTITIQLISNSAMGTMLKIYNPFSKELVYKAELYAYKKKIYIETSTVPVYPKISSYETWPYKIDKLRLTGFILKEIQ